MSELNNYRAAGLFDLLSAPVTPIGAFDAEQFKKDVEPLLEKGSVFIAVDLSGLDFLYSDACSAFNIVRQELAKKNGVFAVLTDHDIVEDCLRKAGLDKTLTIFRKEADMMAFSMKEDMLKNEEGEVKMAAEVKSENRRPSGSMHSVRRRVTGRFTKSFNAIHKDTTIKGMDNPFKEETRGSSVWTWTLLGIAAVAAVVVYFVLR